MAGLDLACINVSPVSGTMSLMLALLIAAVVLTIVVGRLAHFHGKPFLIIAQAATVFWLFTTVAELATPDPACKIGWSSLSWVAIVLTPTAWGLFIHRYVNSIRARVSRSELLLLTVAPLVIMTVIATNPWHHLFYGLATGPISSAPGAPIKYDHGPLFFVAAAYLYLFMSYAVIVVTRGALFAPRLHRVRFWAMFAVTCLPILMNVAYLVFDATVAGVDGTPFSFLSVTVAFSWLILSDQFFSIVPVGNRVLMQKLTEPVLFLSETGAVVSSNPAAERLRVTDASGKKAWHPDLAALFPTLADIPPDCAEQVQIDGRHYEVRTAGLEAPFSASGEVAGWLLMLKDVTAIKMQALDLEYALNVSRRRMKAVAKLHAELRNQATSDALTGLANRRELDHRVANAASDPQLRGKDLLLAVIDIDHFKSINDRHGHKTGDQVLRKFAEVAQRNFRRCDLIFRVGGEEFLLILPGMPETELAERLDLMRAELRACQPVGATFSAGIATWTGDRTEFEAAYELADKRLYVAKQTGRDRTIGTKSAIISLVANARNT